MIATTGTLFIIKYYSSNSILKSNHFLFKHYPSAAICRRCCCSKLILTAMSKALIQELDLKMQQMKEYGLITHGYQNENFRYPIHVRRSHDGEKISRTTRPFVTSRTTPQTILVPSSHENTRKTRSTLLNEHQQTILIVPPNKTVRDIQPLESENFSSYSKSPSSSSPFTRLKSSSHYYQQKTTDDSCSIRPHSIACITSTTDSNDDDDSTTNSLNNNELTDELRNDSLSNSSQSLISQSTLASNSSRTITQRLSQKFFSKLFHHSSKS